MRKLTTLCILTVLAVVVCVSVLPAQDMTPEQQAAMNKAMTPGEHHKHLARFSGKFEYTSKMWMAPGAAPMESQGTSEATLIMGGRYLQDVVAGEYAGMPFEGMALSGYDNVAGQYTYIWLDNFGTGFVRATGSCSEDGKTITFEGTMNTPGVPEPVKFKEVFRWVDDTSHVMEVYMSSPEGEMFKTMEIAYTRVK